MGVNGKTTITITEAQALANGARWPFTDKVNTEGLYYILTMMFLGKQAPIIINGNELSDSKDMLKNNPDALIPRMEIDWVRFYIDDNLYRS